MKLRQLWVVVAVVAVIVFYIVNKREWRKLRTTFGDGVGPTGFAIMGAVVEAGVTGVFDGVVDAAAGRLVGIIIVTYPSSNHHPLKFSHWSYFQTGSGIFLSVGGDDDCVTCNSSPNILPEFVAEGGGGGGGVSLLSRLALVSLFRGANPT